MKFEGDQAADVDIVVMATGYKNNFDFVDIPCVKGMLIYSLNSG